MEFTEAYKQTGPCCFSPNSRYLAVAVDYRLVIRDTLSFKVTFFRNFNFPYQFFFPIFVWCILGLRCVWFPRRCEENKVQRIFFLNNRVSSDAVIP
uniref:Uncharacterized protein n=1 Tax=Rhizophora mucronata TaxID=61149 RepID=A0A2P2IHJ3_RHIMU